MNESQTIRIIIAAIFMIVAAFFMGYFLGNTAENTIQKAHDKFIKNLEAVYAAKDREIMSV